MVFSRRGFPITSFRLCSCVWRGFVLGLREMTPTAQERFWTRRAASLARRVNLGWWLDRFNGLLVVSLVVFALAILAARSYGSTLATGPILAGALGVVVTLLALVAWLISRRHYIGLEEGLVRLDDRLLLHNRLSSAYHRIGPWPGEVTDLSAAAFPWRHRRAILPALLGLALVAAASYAPIKKSIPGEALAPVEPGAWEQIEDWLATLEEENLIDESVIKELESRVEELRDQPEDEWFSHSSLEATDTLAETLGRQLREMASEMAALDRNIAALKGFSAEMSEAGREQKLKEYAEALEALEGSGLAMNEALMKQLQDLDPSSLGQETLSGLSGEQLKSLQEQLKKGSGALGSLEGLPSMGDDPSLQQGRGQGEGTTPGQGGLERGRGDAPLFFGDTEDNLDTKKIESIKNEDLSRATVGEMLGLGETERELDQSATGSQAGGAVSSTGQGGDAVSRERLRPDEAAVLKRYFK